MIKRIKSTNNYDYEWVVFWELQDYHFEWVESTMISSSRHSTEWSHNTQNSILLNELEDYMHK